MKGKKTSSEKIVEVLTAKLANPDLSLREIEEATGVSRSTIDRTITEELGKVGSEEKKSELFDLNLSIINEGTRKIELAMKRLDPETIRDTKEYQEIVNTAFKQNELIGMKGKQGDNVIILQI